MKNTLQYASSHAIKLLATGLFVGSLWASAHAQEVEPPCGFLANAFGPFDYRPDHYKTVPGDQYSHAYKLHLVESAHFTVPVQRLTRGHSSARPGPDLDYTLRAFPNNHRALVTVLQAAKRFADPSQLGLPRTFECYFDRALRFAPDDGVARLIYANFLIQGKRVDEAVQQIDYTLTLAGDNPLTHFNIGMSYFDAGAYDKALQQAHRVFAMGYTREDLKARLEKIGRWADAAPAPAVEAASAPSVAPAASAASAPGTP